MSNTEEVNLVEIWLRKDPIRWLAGAMGGAFAGFIMLLTSSVICLFTGPEFWYPVKVPLVPFIGAQAMELGMNPTILMMGFAVHEALCMFLGIAYAHFTGTNKTSALLGVGLAWGLFSWVFINNLFTPSFREVYVLSNSPGVAFFLCVLFGLTLSSVGKFDQMLRRK